MRTERHNVAIAAIWFKRYGECSDTHGTSEYPKSVWRFYHSLHNLGEDKLAIKDIVTRYIQKEWYPKTRYILERTTKYTTDPDVISFYRKTIEAQYIHEIFDKIAQTIQDSGIGWPTIEEMKQYMITQE